MSLRRFFKSFSDMNILQQNQNLSAPIFALDASKITVISKPDEFYAKLKELASTSKHRISISSLYLGTTKLEKDLLSSIVSSKDANSDLKIRFLLDYNRANRETISLEDGRKLGKSSKYLLQPLVNGGAEVSFFLTQRLGGWKQFIQRRQEWNELCALHHMKLYIFDNSVIVSGANLSDLYFKNRQDRYVLIEDAPALCDYFDEVIKTVSRFSMRLNSDGQFQLHDGWKYDPRQAFQRANFDQEANRALRELNQQFKTDNLDTSSSDTFAVPLLNIASVGVKDEEEFTSSLLKNIPDNAELHIASGYFNLTENYQKLLLERKSASILMASEEANGFFNGRGLLKFVPFVYTTYLRNFLKKLKTTDFDTKIWYYQRNNWSFHGKGIWLFSPDFFMTIVGSSNFGCRSVERDNEAQLVIASKNDSLRNKFKQEHDALVNDSRRIENSDIDLPQVPLWVRCYAWIFRSYF